MSTFRSLEKRWGVSVDHENNGEWGMNKVLYAAVAAWATLVAVTFSPSSAQEYPAKWTWPSRAKVHDFDPTRFSVQLGTGQSGR